MFHNHIKITAFIFLWIISPSILKTQIKFHNLTIKNELPSNRIFDCSKDSKGFIWFATDFGLCRFDGIRNHIFTVGENNSGLTESNFTSIYNKSSDELLFISYNGTLFSYKYSTAKFENLSKTKPALTNSFTSCIYKETADKYWIGTNSSLIQTDSTFTVRVEYLVPENLNGFNVSNRIQNIHIDESGVLWLGMYSRGVLRFDPRKKIFSNKEISAFLPIQQNVASIIASHDPKYIFIATGGEGIYKVNIHNFSHSNWRFYKNNINSLPSDRITSLIIQNDSILWAGTIEGLAKINLNINRVTRFTHNPDNSYSLVNDIIHKLFIDDQGILWVATFGGVSKFYTYKNRFVKVSQKLGTSNSIRSNIVNHCFEDKFGNLWLATSKGIDVKEAGSEKYFHYDLPKSFKNHRNEEIIKFFADGNIWWIATWGGGISRFVMPNNFVPGMKLSFDNFYNVVNDKKTISSNFIRSIIKDYYGNIWITTWNGGLNKIATSLKNNSTISFERFASTGNYTKSIASNFIDNVIEDNSNNLWISTSEGLQLFNPQNKSYKMMYTNALDKDDEINSITSMIIDKRNNLWLCAFGGLSKLNLSENKFEIIYKDQKLSTYSIIEDNNGNIWFSTLSSEIGFYNSKTKKIEFYSMLQEVDGFEFYLGDATKDRNGVIYFTGKSGYLYFDPDDIKKNPFISPIYITSIKFNGKELTTTSDVTQIKKFELDYSQKNISLGFASLNYINSEDNQYKYRLEGYNDNWIFLGKRSEIDFVNLPSGNYTLRIIGSNNDGVWNEKGLVLSLSIAPPFYENNYFRIIIILGLIALVYLFFQSKIKRYKKEKRQQSHLSKLLIESQEDERKRLSKELHDSLGQNLLVIKNRLALYQMESNKADKEIDEITDLIKESINEVKEISSNLHPHQLERLGLNKAIQSIANKISTSSNIDVELKLDEISGILSKDKEINIYRIIQESLNNIVKHSCSLKAIIEITRSEKIILIKITDFGKGIDLASIYFQTEFMDGLGLKSIKERVRLLDGELNIDSTPGQGTTILITINY